ncbi:MAG: hypothetical protein H7A52_18880 [Akkermansiaceae bacterium]|nr:hypothetical protein [Akkermansiaceae bacterium]
MTLTTEFDNRAYVPGETLRGRVSWPSSGPPPEEVEVRLFYYTEGKGDRDIVVVDSLTIDRPSAPDSRDYAFRLPEDGPFSFSGKLVSLVWAVEAQRDDDGDSAKIDFVYSPTGQELDLYAHDDGNLPKTGIFGG